MNSLRKQDLRLSAPFASQNARQASAAKRLMGISAFVFALAIAQPAYAATTLGGNTADNDIATGSYSGSTPPTSIDYRSGVILNGFTLTDDIYSGSTYGEPITGTGSLAVNGINTITPGNSWVLTTTNSFTGTTTVYNNATLVLDGGGSTLENSTVLVNQGSELYLDDNESIVSLANGSGDLGHAAGGGAVSVQGGTLTLTNASGTFGGSSSSIDGAGGLTISGGTETLTGSNNNYTGATTIANSAALNLTGVGSVYASAYVADSGTFDISGTTSGASIVSLSGASTGVVNLGSKTLTITDAISGANGTFAGTISGTGGVTLTGGTETLSGASTYTGATSISGGATLAAGAANIIADSVGVTVNGTFNGNGYAQTLINLTGSGSVTTTGASKLTVDSTSNTTFSGVISDATGGLTKTGSAMLTLSNDNTYAGETLVNAGTLRITAADGNAVADSSDVNLNASGATLDLDNTNQTINNLIGVSGSVVTLGSGTLTNLNGSSTAFAGSIEGTGGLTQGGVGTLTLSGTNTYTGATAVNTGSTLKITGTNAIADSSSVTLNGTGTLALNGTSQQVNDLNSASSTSSVTLGAGTLTDVTNDDETFAGVISGSTGNLVVAGTNTLTLTNANTYTGSTTVNSGATLALSGTGSIADSSGVADAGTFDISATTSGASVATVTGAGGVNLGTETLTLTAGSGTFSGAIAATAGNLVVDGSGTYTLSGTNLYTGSTTIGSGETLALSGTGSIADSSGVADAGTFDISATTSGASVATVTGAGGVNLGTETLTLTAGSGTFSGAIAATAGNLVVDGSGTYTLSGTNLYTGSTTIGSGETLALSGTGSIADSSGVADAGTFSISGTSAGASVKTVTGAGGVNLGTETLTLTAGSGTFSGAIAATAGNLVVDGSGTYTLSGTNLYTGLTTIGSGETLALSGTGSIADSSGVAVTSGGHFDISNATTSASVATVTGAGAVNLGAKNLTLTAGSGSYTGAIAGTGNLTINGSGTWTLGGVNTYTGTTTIGSGETVTASVNNVIADSSAVTISSGATFNIGATSQTINDVSGNGSIAMDGGTLTENGTNTFTGVVGNGGTLGSLVVTGDGTWNVTGANTYTGTTTIMGGSTLQVTGSVASSTVTIDSGAVLTGTGTVTNAVANDGGTITPGDAPGTLTVGSYTSTSGSTLNEELTGNSTAGNYGKLVVTGNANITNTALDYTIYAPGAFSSGATKYVRGTTYNILTAGSITGTFSNAANGSVVDANSTGLNAANAATIAGSSDAALAFDTTYTSTAVDVTILRAEFFGQAPGATPNEKAAGAALDTLQETTTSGDMNTVLNALSSVPTANQAAALNMLTGEINANIQGGMIAGMDAFNGLLGKRLGGDCDTPDLDQSNPLSPVSAQHMSMGKTGSASNASAWGCGYGNLSKVTGNGDVNSTLAGGAVGLEYHPTSPLLVRVGFGYGHDSLSQDATSSNASLNNFEAGAYGQYNFAKIDDASLYVGGSVAGGYNYGNTTRNIDFGGLTRTATANPDGYQVSSEVLLGFVTKVDGISVEPVASAEYIYNNQGSYTETGAGAADLAVSSKSSGMLRNSLGGEVSTSFDLDQGMTLAPEAHAAFIYDALDVTPSVNESFAGTSAAFTATGQNPGRTGVQGGAGLALNVSNDLSVFADYNGTFKDHETDNAFTGGVKINW